MGNTRPSRTCVIQEYKYYTMSLSPDLQKTSSTSFAELKFFEIFRHFFSFPPNLYPWTYTFEITLKIPSLSLQMMQIR